LGKKVEDVLGKGLLIQEIFLRFSERHHFTICRELLQNSPIPTDMISLTHDAPNRWRYVSDICLGTTLLWFLLRYLGDTNPVWAIISFIVVTDPTIEKAHPNFMARVMNTAIGCLTGVVFVTVFGATEWLLPVSLTATALVASLLRLSNWRLATATAALVVSSAIIEHSSLTGLEQALRRTVEVVLGSVTAVLISWLFSAPWRSKAASFFRRDKE
jgi:uncharacterized membrane protein YgaE (UPF0421/DUF939 family)